jgi:excisionase family DNA binding protein
MRGKQMLLSDTELAEVLSVSRNTIWRWADQVEGFPQPVKIGGATRWRKDDVEKYLKSLTVVHTRKVSQ